MATNRTYVRHRWIAHGPNGKNATCMCCGIGERAWEKRIENAPMIEWDCLAMQEREKKKKP